MRIVVGLVPLNWARTRMTPLAVWVRPGHERLGADRGLDGAD